ncbi:hypothetical protein [Serratia fonticola]|uniref:Uncharacterized protein n=1 Tax=Serratia fonticola TaxID=47917 RepID=A0AAW3WLP9_SERFO|nr:hypothetical protein [Serratia fonticola]MBC3211970.1 hypothetical protein [Serratia fonticola]NYA13531.1 hypothetical protein [Serratia fonticola]NYA33341.1 hypothetical protein [Serratia fonticola]
MASKYIIRVHFGDDLFYSVVMSEVNKSKKSSSEFVRDILKVALSREIEEQKFRLNNMYSYTRLSDAASVYPLNLTVDSERQVTKEGFFRLNKIDEILYHEYESTFFGMMSFSIRNLMSSVKNEAAGLISEVIKRAWPEIESQYDCADINLVFVNRVDVIFSGCRDGKFYVQMKIHFHASRFLFSAVDNDDDFLRIDFLNIHYWRFKNVAINGCLSKQYERLLYVKPTRETLLGGFFAGLLYIPKEKKALMEEISYLLSNQDFSRNGMLKIPGKFVKMHVNSEQIKVDRRSFSNGFKMLEERRKVLHANRDTPPWLK